MSGYAWEGSIERSWDALVEDEDGILRAAEPQEGGARGAAAAGEEREEGTVCRNLIRYLCVVVDMSRAMSESDMRPTRRATTVEFLRELVSSFFDENPLSNMSIFACSDGEAHKVTEMSGSSKSHMMALEPGVLAESGEFSLQNGLDVARAALQSVPQHGSKEILVIMASLSTCDQGDIFESIDAAKESNIRCSVVGLTAEVYVAKHLAQTTQGSYRVAQHRAHFRTLLMQHVRPPAVLAESRNGLRCSFVRMGFPSQGAARDPSGATSAGATTTRAGLTASVPARLTAKGFFCPRCNSISEELPCTCPVCGLELIASSHLARSYHHLFPVPRYKEVTLAEAVAGVECSACGVAFAETSPTTTQYFRCPKCETFTCGLCEAFVHETLHNCPACLQVVVTGAPPQPKRELSQQGLTVKVKREKQV